jgi:hypothetical protein
MQAIIHFLVILFASLVAAAEYAHKGLADAGAAKKKYVIDQAMALLNGPLPPFPGLNPTAQAVAVSVLKFLLPNLGGAAVDWLVTRLNASSFFASIEAYLNEALTLLSNTSTTTQMQTPGT